MATAQVFNLPTDQKMRDKLLLLASRLLELKTHSPEEKATTWISPVRWEPLDFDPEKEADALVANVFKFLEQQYGVCGHRSQAISFEEMLLKSMATYVPTGSNLMSRLGLVYYDKSLFAFIVGTEGLPADNNTRPWLEAVAFAEREKSLGHPSHEWYAVIGSTGRVGWQTPTFDNIRLTLGDLNLRSCNFSYEERRPLSSLSSWSPYTWVPIVLEGTSKGQHWRSGEFDALRQVHRLCAILSIETGVHWSLKESPRPKEWGSIQFPETTPLGLKKKDLVTDDQGMPGGHSPINPARLNQMWQRCRADDSVGPPIEAYYQAVSLRDSHPSFALVGFVAAIEEVGKLIGTTNKPDRCPTCSKERTSSSADRFRAALRLVLPEEKIRDVTKQLYRWRSGTAHAGRTYSWESSFGRPLMSDSLLVRQPQDLFKVRGTMRADELSRELILMLLNS